MELVVGSGRPITVTDLLGIEVSDDSGPSPTFATGRDGPPVPDRSGEGEPPPAPSRPAHP
jgi:hypothetical protein